MRAAEIAALVTERGDTDSLNTYEWYLFTTAFPDELITVDLNADQLAGWFARAIVEAG